MRTLIVAFMLVTSCGFASEREGLADAVAARDLLGPGIWARIVRIENEGERGIETRSAYGKTTYALIFEISGILWFYCDENGTQSLSLRLGTAQKDKLDPGPLFRAISPHFVSWKWVAEPDEPTVGRRVDPPNACFLRCLAILRQRLDAGEAVESPRVLALYIDTPTGRLGHTVLVFDAETGTCAVDPDFPRRTIHIPDFVGRNADSLARFIRRGEIAAARLLAIGPGVGTPAPKWASLPTGHGSAS